MALTGGLDVIKITYSLIRTQAPNRGDGRHAVFDHTSLSGASEV